MNYASLALMFILLRSAPSQASSIDDLRSAVTTAYTSIYATMELMQLNDPATEALPSHALRRIYLADVPCEPSIMVELTYDDAISPHTFLDRLNYQARFVVTRPVTFRRYVDKIRIVERAELNAACSFSEEEVTSVFTDMLSQSKSNF